MQKGLSFKGVKKIVDTAGFEDVKTKIKRFLVSGMEARLKSTMFDASDLREIYEEVPIVFEVGDDIDDIKLKLQKVKEKQIQVFKRVKLSTSQQAQADNSKNLQEPVDPVGNLTQESAQVDS